MAAQPAWHQWGKPPARRAGPRSLASLFAAASLDTSLLSVSDALNAEREWRESLATAIAPVEVPAIGGFLPAQVPFAQQTWGPKDGYAWAVQRLTIATLTGSDSMQVYRGASVLDASGPQNLMNSWLGSNGTVQTWNPGRTGCMLAARQTLVFSGTLSGGPYIINADVIQLESWLLPYFLL